MCNNKIEFVRGDLFEGFENLNEVSIYGNDVRLIEPNILDGLDKLDCVQLGGNQYPITEFSKRKEESLDPTKNDLILQYYKNHKEIKNFRKIDNENKQYKSEIQKVLVENKNLQQKLTDKIFEICELKNKQNVQVEQSEVKLFIQADESFKDLKIVIEGREFPVHKVLVAARSPTLAEILRNNPEVENLKLIDVSVEIFDIILKFLYTDEYPNDNGTNFYHLYAAAGKLKIEKLKNHAAIMLIDKIDENNALDILRMSNKYDHKMLREKAFDEIKKKFPEVIFEDKWAADIEIVTKIVEGFKIKEEMIKKAEEEFQNLLLKSKNLN